MFSLIDWYLNSLAQFWSSAIRIGLPQILLVVLLICWMRRRRCGGRDGASGGNSCCWLWSCERGDDGWSAETSECNRACGCCCRRDGGAQDAEEEDGDA